MRFHALILAAAVGPNLSFGFKQNSRRRRLPSDQVSAVQKLSVRLSPLEQAQTKSKKNNEIRKNNFESYHRNLDLVKCAVIDKFCKNEVDRREYLRRLGDLKKITVYEDLKITVLEAEKNDDTNDLEFLLFVLPRVYGTANYDCLLEENPLSSDDVKEMCGLLDILYSRGKLGVAKCRNAIAAEYTRRAIGGNNDALFRVLKIIEVAGKTYFNNMFRQDKWTIKGVTKGMKPEIRCVMELFQADIIPIRRALVGQTSAIFGGHREKEYGEKIKAFHKALTELKYTESLKGDGNEKVCESMSGAPKDVSGSDTSISALMSVDD